MVFFKADGWVGGKILIADTYFVLTCVAFCSEFFQKISSLSS